MMIFWPGSTRLTLIMVWAQPAPMTPGRVLPGKVSAFSLAPVARMIFSPTMARSRPSDI